MNRAVRSRVLAPLAVAVAAVAAVLATGGDDETYRVKIVLADAAGVEKNFDVKIDGVKAGVVKSVDLDARDHAVLTVQLEKRAGVIGVGAKALARPANLLGEKYIDLRPGDRTRPQPSGSVIPVSRTAAPLELDDLINTLDAGTRVRLRILINEAGTALSGRGADFNALLAALPDAIDDTRRVVDDINTENARVRRTISAADRVAAAVDGGRDDLQRVVTDAAGALDVVAQRRRELGATVAAAPAALGQLNGTLTELRQASSDLIPASRALRRTAPPLQRVLAVLPSFVENASDTLAEAQTLAPALSRLGRQATPDLRRVDVTAKRLATFAKDLAPVVNSLDHGVLKDAIDFMNGWSQVIAHSDGLSHVFHIRAVVNQELLTNALGRYTRGAQKPVVPAERRHKAPSAAPAAQPAPAPAAKRAPPAPPALPQLPVVEDVIRKVDGVVKGVLDPLLGGLGAGRGGGQPRPPEGGADALRLFDYLFGT